MFGVIICVRRRRCWALCLRPTEMSANLGECGGPTRKFLKYKKLVILRGPKPGPEFWGCGKLGLPKLAHDGLDKWNAVLFLTRLAAQAPGP